MLMDTSVRVAGCSGEEGAESSVSGDYSRCCYVNEESAIMRSDASGCVGSVTVDADVASAGCGFGLPMGACTGTVMVKGSVRGSGCVSHGALMSDVAVRGARVYGACGSAGAAGDVTCCEAHLVSHEAGEDGFACSPEAEIAAKVFDVTEVRVVCDDVGETASVGDGSKKHCV